MPGMRLMIYNIRYATGTGPAFHLPVPGAGYLRSSRQVLSQITDFIKGQDPDVVGLIEVDTGSIRTGMVNQADFIARSLGHYSTFECKYGQSSVNQLVPIVRKQANAFLAAPRVRGERFHYFDTGIKRLIIELELDDIAIFLVHLSLKFRHRQYQLRYLYDLVRKTEKPVIVAGDFNTYWGDHEIYLFMQAAGLSNANARGLPSYPSSSPRKELDFILHSSQIEVNRFEIPDIQLSDHLPLICDFTIHESRQGRSVTHASSSWTIEIDADRIAWLTCDMPGTSANVLSAAVIKDLAAALTEIAAQKPAGVVLCSAKPSGFIAGADIKEFVDIRTPEEGYALVRAGQMVFDQLEALPCPSVAAIHGFALGGGLELALAATYRVGADEPQLSLGLPEVMLGIHPGFGGTVRSVRLIGVRPAFDLMLKGKPYQGARALEVGLIDRLVPPAELKSSAKRLVLEAPPKKSPPFVEKLLNLKAMRPFIARQATAALRAKMRKEHYPAPYAMIDLWHRYGAVGAESFEAEAHSIADTHVLGHVAQSRAGILAAELD